MELLKNILLWIFSIFGALTLMSILFFSVLSIILKRINSKLSKTKKNEEKLRR